MGYYNKDKKDGQWKEFDNSGTVVVNGVYDNGEKRDGVFKGEYYSEGKKAEESIEYYDYNSVIMAKGLVIDDNLKIGNWIYYHKDGAKKSSGEYVKNKKRPPKGEGGMVGPMQLT